jgi:threonine dehydratase
MPRRNQVTSEQIRDARTRIRPFILNTPVLTNSRIDDLSGCHLFFKCENLQHMGAFKVRGATNAIISLSADQRKYGVATHSSGNHGQAVARAAKLAGTESFIVMPRTAQKIKRRGVLLYDGTIIDCEPTQQSRESVLADVLLRTNAMEIHPFNNYEVIAGQATVAAELIETVEGLHYILAPVGGGGLLSGTALTANYFSPSTEVIGGEPEGANDAFRSLSSGKIEKSQADSIADGLLASLGDKTFGIIKEHVNDIITVTDKQIISAMRLIWEELKVIVEPSGAVPLAAVMKEKNKFLGKRVGIILTGGNVDLDRAMSLFDHNKQL